MNLRFFLIAAALCGIAPADVKLKASYISAGQSSDYTVYLTKNRQRFEYGAGATIIRQMDANRLIDVDDAARNYVVMPLATAATTARKGGVVTVTSTVVDTGERKNLFGLEARHLKTTVLTVSGSGACAAIQQKTETDGWYVAIDYPAETGGTDSATEGCRDEYRYTGDSLTGYPVAYTTKTGETTVTME